jgi:riboflavin biosynthesis pyrimidine reductase
LCFVVGVCAFFVPLQRRIPGLPRKQGVSYLFGGKKELDFALVLDKLGRHIKTLLLGGGHLQRLPCSKPAIDELSLLHFPVVDGHLVHIFRQGEMQPPVAFISAEQPQGFCNRGMR